jgi:hypothetical protein
MNNVFFPRQSTRSFKKEEEKNKILLKNKEIFFIFKLQQNTK